MLGAPPRLEFGWSEIAQRGMNPLVHIHVIQEAADVVICIMIVEILGQVNLLFFDDPDEVVFRAILAHALSPRLGQGFSSKLVRPFSPREVR